MKDILLSHGYLLMDQIGAGGFATCYKVWDQKYQQTFVCKAYQAQEEMEKERVVSLMNQYSQEIEALCKMFQTYIMRIYNYFMEDNIFFLILEYCPNGSIQDYVKREGPLEGKKLMQYVYQAASALQYCHVKQFAHHDVKPANLLIDENLNIKLADFGMAQCGTNQCDKYGGTVAYLAPEVFQRQPYDPFKSDVWSFGATVFYMASGVIPFSANSPSEMKSLICNGCYILPRNISPEIRKLIKNTMIVRPEERWNMEQVLGFVKQFQETKISSHNSASGLLLIQPRNSTIMKNRLRRRNSTMSVSNINSAPVSLLSSSSKLMDLTFAE